MRPSRVQATAQATAIAQVAHQVGYGSGFALSAACKRVRGISAQQHRRAVRAG